MPASTAGEVGGTVPTCLWQGDTFHHLVGFTPSIESLLALTQPLTESTWSRIKVDPAMVLLVLRQPPAEKTRTDNLLQQFARAELLDQVLDLLETQTTRSIDFHAPALRGLYSCVHDLAERCQRRAELTLGRVDVVRAWCTGLFAGLGWLTVAATAPQLVQACREDGSFRTHPLEVQRRLWGVDQDALTRQMARRWGLPTWLTEVVGRLRLSSEVAADLGVHRGLFEVVQQAAFDQAQEGSWLALVPFEPGLNSSHQLMRAGEPPSTENPYTQPLLPALLRVTRENRRLGGQAARLAALEEENDRLHGALANRLLEEQERIRSGRLQAVAELAAGAGHEINNPLAVISGQAQYLLSHREAWFADEALPRVVQSLDTIIGQTRRIHTLLRQLMLFARPPVPHRRTHDLHLLIGEAIQSLEPQAQAGQIQLEGPSPFDLRMQLDREQFQTALTAVLRNAIEAQSGPGWVRVSVAVQGGTGLVEIAVEDGGPGPTQEQVPFLFDPFYSGRAAGRGKGLGLPVAWQLVRQLGGELRYNRPVGGPTRFLFRFPIGHAPDHHEDSTRGEAA